MGRDKNRESGPAMSAGWRLVAVVVGVVALAALSVLGPSAETIMSDEAKREKIESLYQRYQRKFPDVEGITADELIRELADGRELVLVDVRKPAEQEVSMIPGAMTQKQFEKAGDSLQGKEVVTYCTAGYRSGLYAKKLQKRGWQVRNLEGSLLAWTHAGGELEDSEGPTRRLHVYSAEWSLESSGYEPVW